LKPHAIKTNQAGLGCHPQEPILGLNHTHHAIFGQAVLCLPDPREIGTIVFRLRGGDETGQHGAE